MLKKIALVGITVALPALTVTKSDADENLRSMVKDSIAARAFSIPLHFQALSKSDGLIYFLSRTFRLMKFSCEEYLQAQLLGTQAGFRRKIRPGNLPRYLFSKVNLLGDHLLATTYD